MNNMRRHNFTLAVSILAFLWLAPLLPAHAQAPAASNQQFCEVLGKPPGCFKDATECKAVLCIVAEGCDCICSATTEDKCPSVAEAGGEGFSPITLVNPLGANEPDISTLAARVIQMITGITGSLALLMFVWGGFLWTTSAGDDEKVKKAKQIFSQSVLGLVIIFGAYAILTTILKTFTGAAS